MAAPGDASRSEPAPAGPGLEAELGWSLHRVSTAFRQLAPEAVAGVPGGARGYQVLVAAHAGPPASQLALAQQLGIDRTAMTYLVDEMETAGLVARRPHPTDRRVRHVVLTDAGLEALDASRRALRSVEARMLGDLAPAEAAQLRSLLVRVARSTEAAVSCETPGPAGRDGS
ncbi:MarR family winged helix-turn-helix transcriptional regulator [Blastococcus xanthinilyticus]|uniref:DNA-binding MarR family transcriptional regulator n=1 Tax=Blastococcus xanthinilyticus TaxID=1564164 RepID=A0A5S5CV20_9ACTN|nr:MarR family transcriptional regulator [Blastococcus xanthinilyticus]TYP86924.1 DNA-binding MarR family transcriptional regulator [Blastococcus xanthinilyticus]